MRYFFLKYAYSFLKNIYNKLYFVFSINWTKTLYFNFKMLPFNQAKILPIVFYGPIKLTQLNGEVLINCEVKSFMCRFGANLEIIKARIGISEIRIDGTFIINGSFETGNDFNLQILNRAIFSIGNGSYLGSQTKIICTNKITVGHGFRFGYESQMTDSNYHYTIDLETNTINRYNGEVLIGDYCWVGNRTTVMKGTITPDFLIVASNSLLNKDYTQFIPQKSLIGGSPARLLRKNIIRVFDPHIERHVNDYFLRNPQENNFILKEMINV